MPKVKIIGGEMLKCRLEDKINEFIENKNIISISYTAYMCGYSTYREAIITYEDGPSYPIISGKIADEIREQLQMEPTEEVMEGIAILKELFAGREK